MPNDLDEYTDADDIIDQGLVQRVDTCDLCGNHGEVTYIEYIPYCVLSLCDACYDYSSLMGTEARIRYLLSKGLVRVD